VSVRPYRGSFKPVGMAHPVTSHIEPLAAQARPVRSRGHRVDSRMLDRPPRPVGAVTVLILAAQLFALIPQPPGNAHAGRRDLPHNPPRHLLGRKQEQSTFILAWWDFNFEPVCVRLSRTATEPAG
jgi:hypothetical protein